MTKKNKKAVLLTTPSTVVARVTSSAPVVSVTSVSAGKKKKKKKRRGPRGIGLTIVGEVERAWIAALNNPFECVPLPIGLGNMYPSEVVTAYVRSSFLSNGSDGSFQIWLSPGQWNNANAAAGSFVACDNLANNVTPTFVQLTVSAANQAAIQAAFDQYRVLAGGIRVINSGSWSGASGIMASCVYPQDSTGKIRNDTSSGPVASGTLINFPQMDWTRSYDPLQVLWRPTELLEFGQFLATGAAAGSAQSGLAPACVVVGTGGTNAATIYFEAIVHLEVYNVSKGVIGGTMSHQPRATASAETMGGAYQSIVDYLEPATQSIVEWSKEAAHTLGQSALAGGLAYAQRRLFRSRGNGFMGSSPFEMIELKSNM